MDSLLDKNLITTREASELSGYHSDYLGRLCREGKISGSRVGRSWVIDRSSILRFVEEQELQKKKNAEELAHSREEEYKAVQAAKTPISAPVVVPTTPAVVRAVVPPAPAPVSIPSPYFSPKELQEKMVATLVAFLVITVGLYGSEAKFVERGARVAVETLENTSDIGTQAIASALKQGAVQLAAFRIGQEKFGMAFVSRVESGLVLYKGTITGAGEQLATDEVIAISSGAIDSLASQGSNGIVDTLIGSAVALGNTVVGASDAILNAHNNLATAWAEGSAAVPPRLITAFYGAGTEAIALVSNVPSAIALGYENATYAWIASTQDLAMRITRAELSVGTVALERTNDVVIALTTPEVPSDGARGALAELFETRLTTPSTPTRSLAAASAATDFFAPARSLALFTYETINGFFSRTGAVLAGMFAPNIAYAPEVSTIPTPLTVTSVTNIATSSSYITYITNPVSYIYSGTGGASIAYVQKAMDNLRRDLADRDDNNNSGGGLADITGSSIEELSDVATMTKSFGDVFLWNGTEWTNVATSSLGIGAGTGAPGGASGQVQYNNAGVFAGDAGFTYDVGAGRLTATYASTTGISTAYASSTLLRAGTAIIDSLSATLATLTGLIATDATTTNATSTNLAVMNSFALGADRFTDLTGPGLTASSGTLAVDDVTPAMLQAADFGAFTCNGTSCALDAASISDTHINFGSVTLADFTNDAGFITSAITSVGPTGQMQTGSAITLATTSTAFNGLTASTTITASGNIITFANTLSGRLGVAGGGTGTTTAPTYGQLLVGDGSGGYALLATSSLGISGGTPGGANGQVQFNNAGAFGGSAAFTFDSTAGRLSASYASTTGFSSVYASSTNLFAGNLTLGALSGILKASGGVVSVATAGVDYLTSAITSIGPAGALQTGAAITLATSTAGTDFTITAAGNTLTFNLPSASATNRGVLSSADWSVFNNKISSTSLSASAPLSYNPSTGSFTITQATTGTNGYVSAADFTTFNNKISSTSLSAGAGISYVPATGVITNTGVLTTSGDWTGTFDGQQGTYYLDRTNHTGTQLASTISDFASVARSLFSSSATGLTYTAGTGAFSLTSGYVIPLVASTTQWDTAFSWGNHATAGYENALSFIYPLVRTVDAISLAFGTTTANTWGAQQTFTGIFATNASSTNATTTNLTVNGAFRGAGLTSCSASGDKLLWNSTTGQFTCGADAGAGGGITAIGAQYSTFQTGSSQTFATSSDTNLGLIITSAGDTHTFTPTWIGTLASGRLNSNVVQGVTNDTNVTGSISAQNLTLGWTGLLSVARGGTGWGNLQANTVLLGNGTGAISTTSAGSNGQVLALVGGVPTWVATSSINNGVASIQQTGGGVAQTGAITFATSSATNNGVTIGLNITNTGGAFTFTPSRSGTLTVAGGGTGVGTFTSGQLLYGNGTNALSSVATTTFTPSGEFTTTGTIGALIGGSNSTISLATNGVALTKLAQIAANTILGNATGATGNVTAIATSTLFGTGTGGRVLTWNNGAPQWIATTTYSAPLVFSAGNVTITQAGTGANGYLSSTDFNTFNNKISSTSLSGASVISYNSGTGVITTTGGTFGAGNYIFPGNVTAPYASSTAISSAYASSTNAFFGTLNIGALTGILKATGGVVSAATAGVDYLTSAITSIGPAGQGQTGSSITLATSTAGADFTITAAGNAITFNLPSATATARGLLSIADWSMFNNKISSTSLSATAPLSYNSGTGAFTITQATTGADGYLSSIDFNTFNNKVSSSSLALVKDWFVTTNIFGQSSLAPTTTQNIAVSGTGTSSFAGGLEAWRSIGAPYFTATSSSATSTFAGGVTVASGGINLVSSGRIGVGTAAPSSLLTAQYSFAGTNPLTVTDGSNNLFQVTSSGALAFGASYGYGAGSAVNFGRGLGSVSSGNYFVINPGSADSSSYTFRVQEGGTDQFVVNGDGNVGIGTTSPYAKLSVQGNAGISGNLAAANVVATGTLQVAGQTTLATSLSGLLKATAGVIGNAVAGTDYVAGGAGAATTTLSTSGVLSFTANPVVFGSSPISLSITQSGTGASGYLSSTDFNTFNNKISSTSLSAGAGISYVSGTGVITNTGVTSLAGTANQITASAATGAITLSVPSQFNIQQASTTMLSSNGPIYIGTTSTTTIRGNATSTFSGGVNLATGGCYAIGGVCISASGLGAVTSVTNADGTLTISPTTGSVVASLNLGNANVWTALQQFGRASSTQLSAYSAYFGSTATSSFAANGALTLSTALTAVNGGTGQSSYATGDILYADSASSLARLPVSTNGLVLKLVGGVPSWQPDITTGGGGGAGAWSTTTDSLAIYPSDTSDVIIVGASATSTLNSILEVAGRSYFSNTIGIATTSASSLFKLAVQGNALLSGNLSAANITATGTATVGNLTIGSLTGVLKAASGVVSAATAGVDFENPLSFIYPLVRTVDSISLAFGTTTANTWGAQNTFTGLFATNASSTNATTTNLHITSASNGGLASDVNGRVYSAATTTAGTGLTYSGNAFNVNTSQNISTLSNLTSNGLIKTSGGTGALSIATPGTDYVAGGAGAATTTLSTSGALSFSANPVVFGSSPITLSLGIVPVSNGGSGWGAIQAGAIPYGNGTGALATTTQGTGGFVLAWLNGIPTWTATSSISNGLSSIGPAGFLQTGPAITLATSSTAFNGLTASTTITATGNTITFANTLAGVLGVGGGGTGSSTPLGGILTGNGTGAITSATVSAPLTFSGNTLAITQATTGASGYLSSTDFNTFNNKISSTSLSGASVISYNSGTGVITTAGGTFGAGSYVFPGSVTAPYASSTAFSSAYASSTNAFFGTLSIGNLSGVLKATAGLVSAATAGVDYENPLSFVYPIVRSVNSISLAFGTTTQNFWSAYNNFSSLFATNASSTNATTTNLHITSASNGGLATDASGRVYSAATTTAGTGLTYSGNAFSVNTSQNIATLSNLTSNGLIKTSGGTGALSIATPGTDYIAGGAGAATTTLSTSGVLSLSANPVVFGSSPITLSITQSGTGASGYLSQTDFNTFNNKVSSSSLALVKDWFVTTNIFGQSALAPTTTQNIAVNGTGTSTVAGGIEAWRSISAPYFVATGTAATSTLMGGLIVDTNTLVADYSSGRVGVGTASPGAKLEVFGGSIKFMPTGGATDAYLGIEGATATNYLILQTRRYDNNALSRHLAINPEGGNVSVGTTTAYSKLTAWGTGSLFEAVTNASSTVFSIGQNGATTTAFAISGIPSALLKTNANGSIIPAVAGTDYIAGGAGAATTTLSGNSQITLSQPVVIFGSSPSTLSITADSIGDTQLAFNTGQNLTTASTPTFGGLTLTNALTVPNGGTGWGNIQAGAIPYGNGTGALATTTQGTGGFVLAWLNGIPTWVATSSINNGITAIGPTGQQVTSGAVTLASSTTGTDFTITGSGNTLTFNLPSASASNRGLLTSGDWSTFQNKISSTSLSGASVISYNSGTGVITTTGGTFGAGNYVFPGSVTAPYASSTALSSAYASSTNAFFGNLSIGTLTGLLKATAGVVSTATAGVDYENPLSFVYPIIRSVNSISLAFGTTTQNFWSAYNNFGSLFATNASSTNATTTNLHITSASNGGLATDANGRVYSAATTTAGTGLTYSGNAFNVNTSQNIATLSNLTSNGLIKTSGGTGALSIATPGTDYIAGGAGAATTTLTISGPFTTSATPVVFGSSPITATYYGLATTSTLTSSQLLVSNGAAGVYGVSTTTASCAGTASCSAFTILGAAPITITGSGLAAYDAWTHPAAGQSATTSLMLFNGAASSTQLSATRAYFGGTATTTITGAGFVGVGSSSPWAQLSVNPTSTNGTAPAFAIGSSTATSFVVTNAGNVGIGTTSQLAKLTVDGSIILPNNNSYRMLDNAGNGVSILTMSTANNVGYSGSTVSGSMQFSVPNATGAFQFLTGAGLTNVLQITNAGNVGIGTTTPFAKLSIAGAAGGTTNLFAISTSTAGFATSTAVKVDSNGNLSLLNGTTLTTPALTVGSLNGLLKGTAGVVSTATAGTDYVAGGAGAATTTLSTSGVLSFNANPVVFGSSPISLSITQSGSGADGYLSSTDWTSFNSRLSTSTFALLKDWNITTNIFGQSSLTPTTTLNIAVSGTGTSTFAGGLEAWRQISAPYFVATSSTATSTFQGGALLALAGGNVGIGTANPTAGLELGSITAGRNQIINATEGPEMAPALEAANWTASDGWSAGGGSLVKIAGVGTGTITPSGTFTVVAGRTYKVVVTLSAASGNLYDQVGGVAGRENLAAGTHTQYITAITSGKIIFTAGAAVTGTITSLSVKELTPGTGDLTVNGKLTLMSGIYSSAGVGAIDINSELGTIGLAGAKASTAGYGLNVTGNILASANIYATGFSYQSTSYLYLSEAANTASIRNSTSQQTLRTYNTYTDASNYERSALSGVQGQSVNITAETAGTGADNLNIVLTPSGTGYTLLNGNVGIGTTSPYRKLSVQGDAGISGNLSAANIVATGTLNVSGQTTLATSLSGLLKATAGVVSTAVAGTDYLTSAFQNWGLTTNIFGQSSLAPTTTQNIAVSGIGTSTFAGGLEAWRSISAPYFVATSTTATSTFNGGALFAVSGGNVGIGTISPSLKLTVAGGQILVGPADSTNSFINFYNTNYKIGASTGLELYTNTSDRIRFIEGSTERARFDAGGNFGIGTTSPYAKLSVVGQIVGAYFTGTTTATSTFGGSLAVTEVNATSTFAGGIDLSDGCYAIDGNCIGVPGSDGTVNTGAAGYFAYYPSAGTTVDDQTALYLSATGDIGIGTNGPTNYGAGYTALTIDDTTSGRIDISSNGIVQGVLYNSGSTFRVGNVNPNSVALITDDTEQLIIDGSGNVTVTSLGSGLVKSTSGVLSNATAGVDYLAAYDAFTHPSSGVSATTSGLIISASSTIGNGSATGGLTVSGNSTTTGNAIATTFVGNGSSNTLLSQNGTPIVTADVAGNNIAVGLYNAASGGSNSAFGLNNTATAATFSSAFGFGNTASGYLSSAFGSQNTASNNTSMAFGASNNVSGVQAAAFGYAITNAVDNSVMIGPGNTSKLTILNTQKAGFGSTTPYANLSVHANAGETNTTLFAIGSSTASATSTLFSVSNTGSVQTALGSGLVKSTSGVLGLATVGTDYIAGGAGAATTTVTCAGTASCTGFVAFGASPITITGSGLASYDAWTHPAAGQSATTSLMLFNGNASSTQLSATRAYFGGTATTTITAAGFVGVGSSSPWAQLSVNPTSTNGTAPAFAIGSSTDTSFVVWNNGNVSIGTTTASTQKLTVAGTLRLDNGGGWAPLSGVNFQGIMSGGSYYFGKTFDSGNSGVFVYDNSGGYFTISNNNSTLDNGVKISDNLTVTGAATFANASTTNFSANTLAVGGTGTTSISSTGALTTPSLTIGSLSGLLKGTAGAVSVATPGTDYIAGGAGAATTTVSCSGSASCTSFVAFGSSPITISSSALTAYDAWTHPAAGQSATTSLMLFNGNASSTQLSAGTAYFGTTGTTTILGTGFVGVGTSSPWARLSINPIAADGAAPAFAIGSSTGTTFVVTNGGNVGIGTTSPQAPLHIQSDNGMRIQESSNVRYFYVTPPVAGADTVFGNNGTSAGFRFSNTSIGTFLTMNGSSGSVGIGTTTPFAKLSVAGSAGGTTNLFAVSTSTAGFSTSTALYVDSAGSLIAGLNGSKVGIGTTSPGAALEVKGSGTGSVLAGAWGGDSTYGAISLNGSLATGNANFYSNYGGTSLVINRPTGGSVSFRENNAIQMYLEGTTGNFGVGTSTPYRRLSVQGSAGISGDLAAANVVATGTLQVSGQTTLATSLSGLLKATAGVVSNATAGTDYIAGGAGAATTTLTISGPFTTSATPVVFGSSPITATYYGLATTSTLTSSQLLVSNGAAGVYGVSTTSATINNGLTGTLTTLGSGQTIGLAAIAANTVLANGTGGSAVPTAVATSTFFGTGTGGQVLTWNNGVPQWVATTTYSAPLVFSGGNLTITQSGTGANGYLSSTDFNTFNNKISSTSLSGASVISYNSGTGVITTTPGTFAGSGTYTFPAGVVAPYASSTAFSSGYASSTNAFFGTVGIGDSSPMSRLAIVATTTGTTSQSQIRLESLGTGNIASGNLIGGIDFVSHDSQILDANGIVSASIQAVANRTHTDTTVDTDLVFSNVSNVGTTLTEFMRITGTDPKLGIGTTSPLAKLSITGKSSAANNRTFGLANSSNVDTFYVQDNGSAYLAGSFGIGSTTPFRALSVQGNVGISGDLSAANMIATGTLQVTGQTTLASSLTGLLKGTAGVVSVATAGTDYVAGGAGAATSTVTCAGTASCTGFVAFAASPITITGSGISSYDAWTHPNTLGYSATTSVIGIGTTTPQWALTIASSTKAQLTLSDGSLTSAPYNFRSINGNFYLSTSSPTTFATSSVSALSINTNSDVTISHALSVFGSGATGSGILLDVGSGQFTVNPNGVAIGGDQTPDAMLEVIGGQFLLSSDSSAGNNGNRLSFDSASGYNGIGTTSSRWALAIASSTAPQLTLADGSLTSAPINFRSINGNLFISTSSPTTFATTSSSVLSINGATGSTTALKLDVSGNATSSFGGGINLASGCFSINNVCVGSGSQTPWTSNINGGGFTLTNTSQIGVGTSTPWATLAVNPVAGAAANQFVVGSSTATAFVINNSGNVAIGTTTADLGFGSTFTTLTAHNPTGGGVLRASSASIQTELYSVEGSGFGVAGTRTNHPFTLRTNNTEYVRLTTAGSFGIGSSTPWGQLSVNPNALGSGVPEFVVGSSTATHFVVNGAGNVGIGTSSPYAKLSVAGSAVLGGFSGGSISLNNGAASDAYLYFDSAFHLAKNGTGDRITILDAGNVGIGTSGPSSPLNVNFSGGDDDGVIRIDATTRPSLMFVNTGVQAWAQFIDTSDSNKFKIGPANSGVAAATAVLTMTTSGNVGIGTTTPGTKLNIAGGGLSIEGDSAGNFSSPSNGLHLSFNTTSNTGRLLSLQNGVAWRALQIDGSSVVFNTQSGGNVGVGTTSPTRKLTVYSAANPRISVDSNADGNPGFELYEGNVRKWLLFNNTDDSFRIRDGGSSDFFTITSTGNVGIGVAGSAQTLHVASAGSREGYPSSVLFSDTTDTTEGIFLGYSSTGNYGIIAASRLGTAWHNLALAPSGGNVGIGSTSPNANLTVQSSGSVGNVAMGTWASNSGYGAIYLNSAFANGSNYNFLSAIGDALYINRPSATAIRFREANGGTDQFTLNSGGGSIFPDGNLSVCTGGACPSGTPAGNGNIIAETAIGVASSTPWAGLAIASGKAIVVAENTLATSTSMTVDWRNGNQQLVRTGTSATTISFSGFIEGQKLVLTVCNPNATAGAISWGTQVLWAGGTAPTQTTTANKCDVWSFLATTATSTLKIFGTQSANF